MHPIYSAAAIVFGAIFLGVVYYVSSRENSRPHSYSQERSRRRPIADHGWSRPNNNNPGDGVRCGICLDTYDGPTKVLRCLHEFHNDCISQWFQIDNGNRTCPLCRLR